jgi:hypothetical protein
VAGASFCYFLPSFPFMNTDSHSTAAGGPTTLFHRRHARRQRGKTLAHFAPAAMLLFSAVAVVSGDEPLSWITGLEFVVGAAYLVLMVRELRQLRHHAHHLENVAWLELAAAGILALEGYHIWHRHHETEARSGPHAFHVLPWLYWALALGFVGMAFGAARLLQRRHLQLHEGGFAGRLHPLRPRFQYDITELAAAEPAGAADLLLTRTNGQQQRLSFEALHDGPAHRDRLLAHIRQHLAT